MRRTLATTALALALASSSAGCYGSYQAAKKVHAWNGRATNSPIVNSIIHLGFWIVPIYPLVVAGDFLIFNNIEFITGSNPLQ